MSPLRCLIGLLVVSALGFASGCQYSEDQAAARAARVSQEERERADLSREPAMWGMGGMGMGGMGMEGDAGRDVAMGSIWINVPMAELAADVDEAREVEQRVLVYTAALSILVADLEAAVKATETMAMELGGYVEKINGHRIGIRVPAPRFNEAVDRITALGHVANRHIEASDATEHYRDLRLRLRSAEAVLERLMQILERAETVEDLLAVEKELGRVREEIERLKGQIRSLESRITYSAIGVTFAPVREARAEELMPESPFPWLDQLSVERVLRMRRR